jgi:hypothetical protein
MISDPKPKNFSEKPSETALAEMKAQPIGCPCQESCGREQNQQADDENQRGNKHGTPPAENPARCYGERSPFPAVIL